MISTGVIFLILFNLIFEVRVQTLNRSVSQNLNSKEGERIFIIDTDAGADDAVAIFNVLGAAELDKNIQVIGITTVQGNTNVDNVAINVLKILKTARRLDIPVYKGVNQSVLYTPETDDYFGEDGFGDFDYPDPPSEDLISPTHAVNALVQLVSENPGKLSLLCLGPLSNIALAVRLYPKLLKELDDIFILGGSTEGNGNAKPATEFNFYMDPEAVAIVLNAANERTKPVVLVPWEAALRARLPMEWRTDVLGSIPSPQVQLINRAEALQLNNSKWTASDSIMTAVAIDQQVIQSSEDYHVDMETCGRLSRGAIFVDYEDNSGNPIKNVEVVKDVDVELFKEMLLINLNPWGGQKNGAS